MCGVSGDTRVMTVLFICCFMCANDLGLLLDFMIQGDMADSRVIFLVFAFVLFTTVLLHIFCVYCLLVLKVLLSDVCYHV